MERFLAPLILTALLSSCAQSVSTPRPATALVQEIASDRSDPRHSLLASVPSADRFGDLVLVGSPQMCDHYSEALLGADFHNNADGSLCPDGLKDFSGETVVCITDPLFEASEDRLRDFAVRMSVAAVDSVYNLGRYDLDGLGRKRGAKQIILCDPEFSLWGRFDADTLFALTGCGIRIFSPIEEAINAVLGRESDHPLNIALLGPEEKVLSGIYTDVAAEQFALHRARGAELHPFAVTDTTDILPAILDHYRESGGEKPFDHLIIDDPAVQPAALEESALRILSVMCPESVTYGKLLSRGFRVTSSAQALTAACYDALRKENLFTFKIALPAASRYCAVSRPDGSGEGYMTVPEDSYVQD